MKKRLALLTALLAILLAAGLHTSAGSHHLASGAIHTDSSSPATPMED